MIWMLIDAITNPNAYAVRVVNGMLHIEPIDWLETTGDKVRG